MVSVWNDQLLCKLPVKNKNRQLFQFYGLWVVLHTYCLRCTKKVCSINTISVSLKLQLNLIDFSAKKVQSPDWLLLGINSLLLLRLCCLFPQKVMPYFFLLLVSTTNNQLSAIWQMTLLLGSWRKILWPKIVPKCLNFILVISQKNHPKNQHSYFFLQRRK